MEQVIDQRSLFEGTRVNVLTTVAAYNILEYFVDRTLGSIATSNAMHMKKQ